MEFHSSLKSYSDSVSESEKSYSHHLCNCSLWRNFVWRPVESHSTPERATVRLALYELLELFHWSQYASISPPSICCTVSGAFFCWLQHQKAVIHLCSHRESLQRECLKHVGLKWSTSGYGTWTRPIGEETYLGLPRIVLDVFWSSAVNSVWKGILRTYY